MVSGVLLVNGKIVEHTKSEQRSDRQRWSTGTTRESSNFRRRPCPSRTKKSSELEVMCVPLGDAATALIARVCLSKSFSCSAVVTVQTGVDLFCDPETIRASSTRHVTTVSAQPVYPLRTLSCSALDTSQTRMVPSFAVKSMQCCSGNRTPRTVYNNATERSLQDPSACASSIHPKYIVDLEMIDIRRPLVVTNRCGL